MNSSMQPETKEAIYIYLIAAIAVWVTYIIWHNRRLPPGPWGIPIFGYLLWLDPKSPYLTLTNLAKKYGSVYGLKLGNVYTVVLTDPKVIKTVFSKDATTGRAPLYLTHGIMNGYGLICSEGDLWKEHRRFTFNTLRQFGGTKVGGTQRKKMETLILLHALDFVKHIDLDIDSEIDIVPSLRHSLGSVINMIVFGTSWSRDNELWIWLQNLQEEGPKHLGVAGPMNFLPFFRFFPKYRNIISFIKTNLHKTHEVYHELIDQQIKLLQTTAGTTSLDNVDTSTGQNFIQCFVLEKLKKTDENVRQLYNDTQFVYLLADIFGASLDTTLTSLRCNGNWKCVRLPKSRPQIFSSLPPLWCGGESCSNIMKILTLIEENKLEDESPTMTPTLTPIIPKKFTSNTDSDLDPQPGPSKKMKN
ncbi:cytochrome P450 306a1 isoform X3 [Diabrotica virgifera virgifera]|uniref:Cytochrome P450 306a1 n=1 Tax=Diabrotica virgifera virgifera TaxID=50390 RepID=A0ABM5K5R0_DIAVI|nr:cytochrome P450 306a1 isoform X3 [Diabrotica virgifera virgifera]